MIKKESDDNMAVLYLLVGMLTCVVAFVAIEWIFPAAILVGLGFAAGRFNVREWIKKKQEARRKKRAELPTIYLEKDGRVAKIDLKTCTALLKYHGEPDRVGWWRTPKGTLFELSVWEGKDEIRVRDPLVDYACIPNKVLFAIGQTGDL